MPGGPLQEVEAILSRAKVILESGAVTGVRDLQGTAIYMAATEVVEESDLGQWLYLACPGYQQHEPIQLTAEWEQKGLKRRGLVATRDVLGQREGPQARTTRNISFP